MSHINNITEALNQFPLSQGNSRAIAREAITHAQRRPSERAYNKAERLTGLSADFADSDWGTGQRGDKE